jgi:hypothetical protein
MKSYFEALELPDLETRSTRKKGEAQKQSVAPGVRRSRFWFMQLISSWSSPSS